MKTIELVKFTGEMTEKEITVQDELGKDFIQIVEVPVAESVKEYTCEDGEENSLLSRARLTAEIYNRDREGYFIARIKV